MLQTIGDLALNFSNRASNLRIRTEMNTLAKELTSGLKSDIRTPLAGDLAPVASIELSLTNLAAYETVINETALLFTAVQSTLGHVSDGLQSLAAAAIDLENTNNPALITNFGKQAADQFTSLVNSLNTTIAGRSLFAGNETATQPVGDTNLIIDDIVASLPPGATAEDISDAVDAFFAPGAGFDTTHYFGSAQPISPFRVSPEDSVTFGVTAQNTELRSAMAATAKAALIDRGILSGNPTQRSDFVRIAGLGLLNANAEVVVLRGDIGTQESRLEIARTRNSTEADALQIARAELVAADPFETATQLQLVQTQLETFYTLTARLSQLNLTGFLR